jgi:hypothetical protein
MKKIFKYPVKHFVPMHQGAKILSCQDQDGVLTVWAKVDLDHPMVIRVFEVCGTGHEIIYDEDSIFVASVQQGPFVWHVFDRGESFMKEGLDEVQTQ